MLFATGWLDLDWVLKCWPLRARFANLEGLSVCTMTIHSDGLIRRGASAAEVPSCRSPWAGWIRGTAGSTASNIGPGRPRPTGCTVSRSPLRGAATAGCGDVGDGPDGPG